MANSITPTDVYAIVNAAANEMFGKNATIQAVNTTTFATVGEAMLRTGYENTLNALSVVMERTYMAIRPYTHKFSIMDYNDDMYGAIRRKISFFYDGAEASQNFNTNLSAEQLDDGKSIDHYTIRKRYPLEINFAGLKVLQRHFTRFEEQLKIAFHSEAEFSAYIAGIMKEVGNEREALIEAENRLLVLNHIGGVYNTGTAGMKINLTSAYNEKYGTTYTSAQLRTTYLKEFLAFMVSTIKYASRMLTEQNTLYHLTPVKNNDAGEALTLLRHTPMNRQKLFLLAPLMIDAEANVLPEIFNDRYLSIENYEAVNYWQNPNDPGAISVTPNQLNVTTGQSMDGAAVTAPYIVGLLFDRDALAVNWKLDKVRTTPINAAGDYYNTYYHWVKNYTDDFTENSILLYMEDEE